MPAIKPMDQIKGSWKRRSAASVQDYEFGIRNPKKDWAQETVAAEENYNAGVRAAMERKAYGKGVSDAGTAKWQKNAIKKGTARWSEGINLAEDAYVKGFAPYRTVIENLTLSPRGPKGSPQNITRVAEMA